MATGLGELALGPAKRRSVLATLLLRSNTAVPMAQLIDAVWEEEPPAHARTVVQGHVSRLRVLFAEACAEEHDVRLTTRGSAYVMEMPNGLLDAHRFEELVRRGQQEETPGQRAARLRDALGLWRGPALTGTVPSTSLTAAAQALEETRLATVEQLAESYGLLGDLSQGVALLKAEVAAYPLRESLTTALMVMLYRAGRQSDALERYDRTRCLLAEELGVSPGPAMRAAYEGILRGDLLGDRPPAAMPRGLVVESSREEPHRGRSTHVRTSGHGLRSTGGTGTEAPVIRATRTAEAVRSPGPVRPDASRRTRPTMPHDEPARRPVPHDEPGRRTEAHHGPSGRASAHDESPRLVEAYEEPTRRADAHDEPARPEEASTGGPAGRSAPPRPAPDAERDGHPIPRLLPRGARGFHGRAGELAGIDAATGEGAVALVTGAAGVGKSALALHWAHRHQHRFPDGTLFADLRGFGEDPVQPDEVLREFLMALGVRPRALPESAARAAALYRELTADRELLVVLDDVRNADQVRRLLPSGPRSAVLVTSRLRLSGLIVEGLARPVPLGLLGPDDAVGLLASAVGAERVAAEPDAAARLVRLCDGLPLALRITAAQLVTQPNWRLADLAAELADEQRRLSLLSLDDSGDAGVAAALGLTVQGLPPGTARLFALLGSLPGTDLDRYTAAALSDGDPVTAGRALDRLAGAHLVTEYVPGRYALHELVRLYARGLPGDRNALVRVLDHHIATALRATAASAPEDQPCCTLPDGAYAPPPGREFGDRQDALRWYVAERENLAAAVTAARAAGHDDRAWRLVVLQWPYITWNVRDGWVPLLEQALDAAVQLDDPDAETRVRALLGWVLLEEGRLPEALRQLEPAPALAARTGDASSEATALVNLALALERDGDVGTALAHATRAVELTRKADDPLTELLALELEARLYLANGDVDDVLRCTEHALTVLAGRPGLPAMRHVMVRLTRGEALHVRGDRAAAAVCAGAALADAERLGYKDGIRRGKEQRARWAGRAMT
ncbi:AfsR/SARP family transcriptional regulator [Streptomyces roseicoloratus]|uniref:AfsR/SARP family transcriptional regulator n=1 Tax=Streptomyces roseicoloratus TaxID=2508722 RepID=UPI0024822FDC|nr:BTAD domain-containing putative transcriptional regulator [Streptomyces roseicoloratus]